MSKEIKELQRIRSILSYVTGFEDDDQEHIEDARKSVGQVIDSLAAAPQPAQRKPLTKQERDLIHAATGSMTFFKAVDYAISQTEAANIKDKP